MAKILGKGRAKVNMSSPGGPVTGNVKGETEILLGIDDGLLITMKSTSDFVGTLGPGNGTRAETTEVRRTR